MTLIVTRIPGQVVVNPSASVPIVVQASRVGVQGPPGLAGTQYVHTQAVPSLFWVIDHNLGTTPAVTITDSAGSEVRGEVTHNSANRTTLTFSAAFSGIARFI